jgi:hypothetical protein
LIFGCGVSAMLGKGKRHPSLKSNVIGCVGLGKRLRLHSGGAKAFFLRVLLRLDADFNLDEFLL